MPDFDGDGLDDILIGAQHESSDGEGTGSVYLLFSPVSGVVDLGDADGKFASTADDNEAGDSVAGLQDMNGDGLGEIAIGSPQNDSTASAAGAVYLIFGRM